MSSNVGCVSVSGDTLVFGGPTYTIFPQALVSRPSLASFTRSRLLLLPSLT
jgi:hypothetical protein